MIHRVEKQIFARLLVFCALLAIGQAARAEQLPVKTYTTANGLLYDSVIRVIEDQRGFLWFCAANGISRFDGTSFVNYDLTSCIEAVTPGSLVEVDDGTYLFPASTGIYTFDAKAKRQEGSASATVSGKDLFKHHPVPGVKVAGLTRVLKTRSGDLLFTIGSSFYQIQVAHGQVEYIPLKIWEGRKNPNTVYKIVEDGEGSLWLGTELGLFRILPDRKVIQYTFSPEAATSPVTTLAVDQQNRLWLSRSAEILFFRPPTAREATQGPATLIIEPQTGARGGFNDDVFYDPPVGHASRFTLAEGLPLKPYFDACSAADGRVWFATFDSGIYLLEGRRVRQYTDANGLTDNSVRSIFEDSSGNIWLCSLNGVMKVPPPGFMNYLKADGLGHDMIIKIFETLEGGVCALSFQGHLSFFDGEKFNTVRPNLPEDTVRGMTGVLQDRTGEWWVGSFLGLYRFPKVDDFHQLARVAPSASYRLMNGFPSDTINSLFEDSRGGIWVSFFGQQKEVLVRWERTSGVFQPFTAADGLPQGTALDNFCEDGNGNLWMTGRGGQLLRYRNGRFGEISLPITRKVGSLSSLYIDSKNRVWICTANDGLQRIDDPSADAPTITRLTIQEGLSSNSINYAVEDDLGRLYVVTSRGMDRLDPDSGQIKQYTREDGLVSTTSGMAIRDKHGVLWLATRRGISRYTPARDKLTSPAPTYIKSVLISGRSIPVSEIGETDIHDVVIEPGELQFQIDFFALSLAAGETLRYQYKLEGADIDWTTPTNQRVVSFPNMAPGSYRFLVRAVLTDGTTTSSPASLSFVVLRPIWQRWWFVAIFLGLVGMLVYVFYRYRVARLLELERVRTRIATDLHDDIGASLSRMAILSEVVKHQTGSLNLTTFQMLTEIADSARSLVDSMSDIVWSIDPRKDDLKSVAQRVRQFASDVLEARHIAWSFETPADIEKIKLPPDERRQLFLIFKEAVTNIAKHSGGSEARLCLRVEGGRLVAEIGDNGCGFAQPDPEISFNGLGGNGLKNMRARASDVGGCLDVDSQPGTGSLIRFILPMKKLSLRGS